MSNNPYAQVALTYLRRPFSSWTSGLLFFAMFCFFVQSIVVLGMGNLDVLALINLPPLALLILFIVIHAKDQFANPRAHLMPHFHRVHGTIVVSIVAFIVVLFPAILTLLFGWHSIGYNAVLLLLFGLILWQILSMSGSFNWLILFAQFWVMFTESGRHYIAELVTGHYENHALGMLTVGAGMVLIGGIRLFRLHEEMSGYRSIKWDPFSGKAQTTGPVFSEDPITKRAKAWFSERQMLRVIHHARRAPGSWWSGICRWQVGMYFGWSAVAWILWMVLYMQVLIWLLPPSKSPNGFMPVGMWYWFTIFMPTLMSIGPLAVRFPALGYELLRPVERKTFVWQLGSAAASSLLQLWGGMNIAIVLWWWLMSPPSISARTLIDMLIFSAAVQVLFYGVIAWMARYRSKWQCSLAIAAIVSITSAFSAVWFSIANSQELPCNILWIATAIVPIGLLVTFDAYRRWLKTDFD